MTDDSISTDSHQDSDYDGAWKESLRLHLRHFIEECFPQLAKQVNWSVEPEWLDKEMSQIIGQSGHRNREVDLLFKVLLSDGREQWILCHLEIQTSYEADFISRIDLYNAGLKWLFRQDVLTLVILADLNRNWRPSEYRFEFAGFESYRRFPTCKIPERLETDWADQTSFAVQVSRAQIEALRTAGDPEARYRAKTQLVRNLYKAGYTADELRELFRLIDWMMHLRIDLSQRFEAELSEYEEELKMPYVTSVERIAEERGLKRGLEQGRQQGLAEASVAVLLKQLPRFCGILPAAVVQQIQQLPLEQVERLTDAQFDLKSIDDLTNWLNAIKN